MGGQFDINIEEIQDALRNSRYFPKFIYLDETDSTQIYLKNFERETKNVGAVALTEVQSRGRGRQGRNWQSVKGKNLTFSILFHPQIKPTEAQLISLTAGMAMKKTLTEICPLDFQLKWPNDILCCGKKLCGIITEAASIGSKILYAVTGIGLNVNMAKNDIPDELADTATSLAIESGATYSRQKILLRFLEHFSNFADTFDLDDAQMIIEAYRHECDTIGRSVRVICDEETLCGTASGITNEGAIIVTTDSGSRTFAAADVIHLRTNN